MRVTAKADALLAMLFVAALFLPLAGLFRPSLNPGPELDEKRELAQRPPLRRENLTAFPTMYEEFFNDHFGFRSFLVRWNSYRRYRLFGIVPGEQVHAGRDGWLFYGNDSPQTGFAETNHAGGLPHDDIELFPKIKRRLEANRDYLAGLGIGYLLVVAPDKWSIYGDHVPDGFASPSGRSTVEDLVEFLQTSTDLDVLDVRAPLLAARRDGLEVYFKGDTHWNAMGAFIASRAIVERIADMLGPLPVPDLDDYAPTERTVDDGDLVTLMGLDGFIEEHTVDLVRRDAVPFELSEKGNPPRPEIVSIHQDRDLPRIMVLRDSFTDALIPFLSPSFGEVHYLWTANTHKMDMAAVLGKTRPTLVVEVKVERFMLNLHKYFLGVRPEFKPGGRR